MVNVPVLSKQNVLTWAPYTVFCGYVPDIPLEPSLKRLNEYAKLKKMGRGGGAEDTKKSINLKNTNNLDISLLSCKNSVVKKVIMLTMSTIKIKPRVDLSISGSFIVLFSIFLIILPLWLVKPVFITMAKV